MAKVDPEVLPKHEERELFKTYVEDYNTATLPHKKYYNIAAYEAKQRAKAAKKGEVCGGGGGCGGMFVGVGGGVLRMYVCVETRACSTSCAG